MARRIVGAGVILILLVIGLMLSITTTSAVALDSAPQSVQVVYTWQHTSGQTAYEVTAQSLGTIIAPNIILTHNHYGLTLGHQSSDTLVITDGFGHTWHGRADDVQLIVINAGTAVIWLPNESFTTTASIADVAELRRLKAGDWLSVNCWDATFQRLAQHKFQIIQIKDGIARLADPDLVISSGDSGGGAFFDGKLIGNVWSINLDSRHQPIGSFNIALLPAQVRGYTG